MTPSRSSGAVRVIREDHLGASTFIEKGWHNIAHGDFEAAELSLRTAIAMAPSDVHARALLAWAMMRQGRYDAALTTLEEVLAREPKNPMALATLGYVYMRKDMRTEAHRSLTCAATQMRDPKAALYAGFYLGLLYAQQKDVIEAERYFRRTLSLAPNFIEALYELGRTFWLAGDQTQAENVWRGGHSANRFSEWGKRCGQAIRLAAAGVEPPSFS